VTSIRVPHLLNDPLQATERLAEPGRHPLIALQQSVGNAAVARALLARQEAATDELEGVTQGDAAPEQTAEFDMEKALATNWKRYGKESRFVEQAMWVVGAPQHKWFPRTALKPYEKAFANKLAEWQGSNGLDVTGELDEATVAALREAMGPDADGATLEERMQQKDVAELGEAVAAGSSARSEGEEAARSAIVSIALGEVGKVLDTDRGDGKKVGAERLRTYYRETVPDYTPEIYDKGIDTPGWYPGGTQAKEQRGAWSWCGIYATWAIRQVTGVGGWAGGPLGFPVWVGDPKLAQKGDLLYKKGGLQHRCIVVANDGTNVTTVNGNGVAQAIHVQTLPVSEYHGFHDVLKATPEQFQADLAAWKGKMSAKPK
jgi:Putative peptidoglycan binding domain